MAVKIRLMRRGKKKQPFYRIVVIEGSASRESRYTELVGTYDPRKENAVNIDEEKALKWLHNGAKPTGTVRNLFSKNGIMEKFHNSKLMS